MEPGSVTNAYISIHGVWIDDLIYWMNITLTNLHTLQITTMTKHTKFFACYSVITSCCKVLAANSGDSS
jgi:hypothetical protein